MPDPCAELLEGLIAYETELSTWAAKEASALQSDLSFTVSFPNLIADAEGWINKQTSSVAGSGTATEIKNWIQDAENIVNWIENLRCNPALLASALSIHFPQIPVPTVTFQLEPAAVPGLTPTPIGPLNNMPTSPS